MDTDEFYYHYHVVEVCEECGSYTDPNGCCDDHIGSMILSIFQLYPGPIDVDECELCYNEALEDAEEE